MSTLNLYLVTFNCGRAFIKPEAFASHFFDGLSNSTNAAQAPDLIVLHLQEIAPIAESFSGYTLPEYYDHFKAALRLAVKQQFPNAISGDGEHGDAGYVNFATANTGLTAIMLFVRTEAQHCVQHVMSAGVGVGVQGMGNKGAIAVRFGWRVTKSSANTSRDVMNLAFVSAHLAPMEEALDRRNQDFHDIVAGLVFEPMTSNSTSTQAVRDAGRGGETEPLLSGNPASDTTDLSSSNGDLIGIYAPDAHLFFSGDLNYRTSVTRPVHDGSDTKLFPQPVSSSSNAQHYSKILPRDQLTEQLRAGKTLHGLSEAPIDFPPTYKYAPSACDGEDIMLDSEVSEWKWSTHRWPSWCDRILYSTSASAETNVNVGKYTALPLLATSDHRPVAMSATVPLKPVMNREFASHAPVQLDPNWRANRNAARWKEAIVGTAWHSISTTDGLMNLTMGIAAVVCFAVLASVYAREW